MVQSLTVSVCCNLPIPAMVRRMFQFVKELHCTRGIGTLAILEGAGHSYLVLLPQTHDISSRGHTPLGDTYYERVFKIRTVFH
jgi:hypothetical protein